LEKYRNGRKEQSLLTEEDIKALSPKEKEFFISESELKEKAIKYSLDY